VAKINKKHLLRIGFKPGEALRKALIAGRHPKLKKKSREENLLLLREVLAEPGRFRNHEILSEVAEELAPESSPEKQGESVRLNQDPVPFEVFGEQWIDAPAFEQMKTAACLSVSVAGALMPDAHVGYGLPIGGVLATDNVVIPFAVGVDIGCRMCLSVFQTGAERVGGSHDQLVKILLENTTFGVGKGPEKPIDDPVLSRPEFKEISALRSLKDKAWAQIGSSGSGNHFVEFGLLEIVEPDNPWGVLPGPFLALLSHSGSRGLGAGIANHFTKVAMRKNPLPANARHLAGLSLDSEEGQEYWKAMCLAGDYASACHRQIHQRISRALGEKALFVVENHHNFAWKERMPDGSEVIVHRKGATPAAEGNLGVIPGSMATPGFVVSGKGNPDSLGSASHGAGRRMSRSEAKKKLTRSQLNRMLKERGVTLVGGAVDESPMAYKDIHEVMACQQDLVEIVGVFQPRIVRMAGACT
jgi:tRNA-splicing ligase RtcB